MNEVNDMVTIPTREYRALILAENELAHYKADIYQKIKRGKEEAYMDHKNEYNELMKDRDEQAKYYEDALKRERTKSSFLMSVVNKYEKNWFVRFFLMPSYKKASNIFTN